MNKNIKKIILILLLSYGQVFSLPAMNMAIPVSHIYSSGKLKTGERIKTRKGTITKLIEKEKRSGTEPVYNLEIYRDHNFYVGKQGLLVHNSYVYTRPFNKSFKLSAQEIDDLLNPEKVSFRVDIRHISEQAKKELKAFWESSDKHLYRGMKNVENIDFAQGILAKGTKGEVANHVFELGVLKGQSKYISTTEANPFTDRNVTAFTFARNNNSNEGFVFFINVKFVDETTGVKDWKSIIKGNPNPIWKSKTTNKLLFYNTPDNIKVYDVNACLGTKHIYAKQKEFAFENIIPIEYIVGAMYLRFDTKWAKSNNYSQYKLIGDFIPGNSLSNFDFKQYVQQLKIKYGF